MSLLCELLCESGMYGIGVGRESCGLLQALVRRSSDISAVLALCGTLRARAHVKKYTGAGGSLHFESCDQENVEGSGVKGSDHVCVYVIECAMGLRMCACACP